MSHTPNYARAGLIGLAVLTLGVGTTAWSTHLHTSNNAQAAQRAVTLAAETITRDVTGRLQLYQYGLRGARGAIVTAGDNLNRDTFHRYSSTRDIAAEFPGARGFGFVRRVPAKDEGVYVANARGEGWPDFTISQLERHDGDRYVIEYIEPVEINRQAVGLDVASETNRRIAAEVSMRTGAATLTGPITLVQASGERLQSFLFMLPIYHADAPTRTTAEREAALFGWSYAPLIMREVLEHIAMDTSRLYMRLRDITDAPDAQPFYETSAPGGNAPELHTQLMTRTVFGRQWEIEISAYPSFISDLNQIPGHFLLSAGLAASLLAAALAAAITVSRQCKQMIDTEQARLATIVENSSDAIVGESLSGIIISWNRAAERLFGYAENEALGRPLAQLLTPGENASGEDADVLERIACGDTVAAFDTVKLRRDGTPIDVSVTAGAIRDAEERLVGVATLMHDIRDRKQKQRRLAEFSARLEREVAERTAELKNVNILLQDMLRAASEVSIIATDTNGIITIFNAGSEKMLGYTAEEMVGKRTPAVLHVPDEIARRAAALNQEYGASIEGFRAFVVKSEHEGSETREWTYVRKDGSTLTVSLIVTTMRDEAGDITGYLGIAEDVTERRRITASLHEAKIAAEAANRAKDQFLAMMSHELRTPLTGIIGMADLLVTTDLKPEQRALLQTQTRSAHTLLDLLNDILDFAKIETGRVELESMNFSVGQIARDIVAVMQPLASERGNVVSVNTDPSVAESYRGDAKRYRQVLMNLVGNAIKFTSKGKIDIVIRAEGTDGSARVETLVSDTGIGIAAVNRDHLFRPFVQEDVSTSRKFGGTGLGLAISKNLV
jgi:PAS domain S-box-containing protein